MSLMKYLLRQACQSCYFMRVRCDGQSSGHEGPAARDCRRCEENGWECKFKYKLRCGRPCAQRKNWRDPGKVKKQTHPSRSKAMLKFESTTKSRATLTLVSSNQSVEAPKPKKPPMTHPCVTFFSKIETETTLPALLKQVETQQRTVLAGLEAFRTLSFTSAGDVPLAPYPPESTRKRFHTYIPAPLLENYLAPGLTEAGFLYFMSRLPIASVSSEDPPSWQDFMTHVPSEDEIVEEPSIEMTDDLLWMNLVLA